MNLPNIEEFKEHLHSESTQKEINVCTYYMKPYLKMLKYHNDIIKSKFDILYFTDYFIFQSEEHRIKVNFKDCIIYETLCSEEEKFQFSTVISNDIEYIIKLHLIVKDLFFIEGYTNESTKYRNI